MSPFIHPENQGLYTAWLKATREEESVETQERYYLQHALDSEWELWECKEGEHDLLGTFYKETTATVFLSFLRAIAELESQEEEDIPVALSPDLREALGIILHEEFCKRIGWDYPWESGPEYGRETDRLCAEAVVAAYLLSQQRPIKQLSQEEISKRVEEHKEWLRQFNAGMVQE